VCLPKRSRDRLPRSNGRENDHRCERVLLECHHFLLLCRGKPESSADTIALLGEHCNHVMFAEQMVQVRNRDAEASSYRGRSTCAVSNADC
jgi:hypothetical protein